MIYTPTNLILPSLTKPPLHTTPGAAKMRAPCVIFIDEIDSVGAKRSNSVLHPYANQTINQLLSEMDGFHKNEGVIVLGATNRRDDLDKALLRPGRFEVEGGGV